MLYPHQNFGIDIGVTKWSDGAVDVGISEQTSAVAETAIPQLTQESFPPLGSCMNAQGGTGPNRAEWRSITYEPIGEPYPTLGPVS